MVKPSILVTRRWPAAVEAQLAEAYNASFNTSDKPLDCAELQQAMHQYDAILPTVTDKLDAAVLDVAKPQTKILGNYGVGYSHICERSAKSLEITVTNTPDVLSECTADIAMTLMLMVARRAGEGEREVRNGAWSGWRPTHLVGTKVSGKTLGLIGFGRIGQAMAQRAHFGFPDAFLINTARGEVIDEHALIQALNFDVIAGAALDVFDNEPKIAPDLLNCSNLVMLPHLGSATREAREAMGFRVLDNLSDFFMGRTPRDRVI